MTTANFELPTLYHGTDLRFVNFPEDLRKNYHLYTEEDESRAAIVYV